MSDEVGAAPAGPPAAGSLTALTSDDWAWLLAHVRRALHDLDDADVTQRVARLRAAPAGRLAGGRGRDELIRLLAAGGPAWHALRARLDDLELPRSVAAALAGQPPEPPAQDRDRPTAQDRDRPTAARQDDGRAQEVARLRERLRDLRAERDELRRKLEGAEARARRDADELAAARAATAAAEQTAARAQEQLAAADDERAKAVAREQRRGQARQARLEEELARLRRDAEERERRDRASRAPASAPGGGTSAADTGPPRGQTAPRLVPGRPSELPAGVEPGTREAVDLLLHPGRLLLVDGYNVTKQHHPELDLERQRAWLVQLLASTVARRRIRAVAVFDGAGAGSRPAAGIRDVTVRFTPEGVTADDELVLAVEGTDEPVVVVTDDRELSARLRHGGADVVGTRPFLWATR